MTAEGQPRVTAVVVAAVLLAGGLFLALIPFTSSSINLSAGDIAFRTVRAPRDISFESASLTAERQKEAAQAVPDTLVYDPSVAVSKQAALNSLLDRITAIRNDLTLTPQARQT